MKFPNPFEKSNKEEVPETSEGMDLKTYQESVQESLAGAEEAIAAGEIIQVARWVLNPIGRIPERVKEELGRELGIENNASFWEQAEQTTDEELKKVWGQMVELIKQNPISEERVFELMKSQNPGTHWIFLGESYSPEYAKNTLAKVRETADIPFNPSDMRRSMGYERNTEEYRRTEEMPEINIDEEHLDAIKQAFGDNWKTAIAEVLPFQIWREAETLSFHKNLGTFFPGRNAKKVGGLWDGDEAQILLREKGTDMARPIIHEMGHAVETALKRCPGARLAYLKAIAEEPLRHSAYAALTVKNAGGTLGIREDFAEAFDLYFRQRKFLEKKCPRRAEAMEELLKEAYPDVNWRAQKTRTLSALKDLSNREWKWLSQNLKEHVDVGGNVMKGTLLRHFPSQIFHVLDYILQSQGQPNEKRARTVTTANYPLKIAETFNAEGQLHERIFEAQIPKGMVRNKGFWDPEYDENGRCIAYNAPHPGKKDGYIRINLSYRGDAVIPEYAVCKNERGKIEYEFSWNKIGDNAIMEKVLFDKGNKSSSTQYELRDGKIISATGLVGKDPIFQRQYEYDESGRVVEKSIFDNDGNRKIEPNEYSYES